MMPGQQQIRGLVGALLSVLGSVGVYAAAEEPSADLTLIYTGAARGIERDVYQYNLAPALERSLQEASVRSVRMDHGVLAQGAHLLWADDHTWDTVNGFLDAGDPTCGPSTMGFASMTETDLLWAPSVPVQVDEHPLVPVVVRSCEAGGHEVTWLRTGEEQGEPLWNLEAFDVREGVVVDTEQGTAMLVGLPRQEASRRFQRIAYLRSKHPEALFVDAGNFVDGASLAHEDVLSPYRALGFDMLRRLYPDALVPGELELASGPARFLEEAAWLPYVATNWSSEDPSLELPDHLWMKVPSEDRAWNVLLLGIIDPVVAVRLPELQRQGVTLADPLEATQEVLERVRKERGEPDAIILLSDGSPQLLGELRQKVRGVDVMLGDRTGATYRVVEDTVAFRQTSREVKAAPVTLPMDGVAVAQLDLVPRKGVSRVRMMPSLVLATDPRDHAITSQVSALRAATYPQLSGVLVPGGLQGVLRPPDEQTWDKLVCEAVRHVAEADVAVIRRPEPPSDTVGPLTALKVARLLPGQVQVERHRVDGDRMKNVLHQLASDQLVACGADLGSLSPVVRGRSVQTDRTYWVASTDTTRLTTVAGPILDGGSAGLPLQLPKRTVVTDERGAELTLQKAVMDQLEVWKGQGRLPEVMQRTPRDQQREWMFRINRLGLNLSGFKGMNQEPLSQIPDTLVTSRSSFTLGGEFEGRIEYSSVPLTWDARLRARYASTYISGEEPSETADELSLSTALAAPVWAFVVRDAVRVSPYGQLLFESEFTANEDAEGNKLPFRSNAFVTMGMATNRYKWLSFSRLGFFVGQSLSQIDDKGADWGGRFEAETRLDLLRPASLQWTTFWDVRLYGDTPVQNDSDLRFRGLFETRLSLRLIRWMQASTWLQTLAVRGRVPENDVWGVSLTIGVSIELATAFQLNPRDPDPPKRLTSTPP